MEVKLFLVVDADKMPIKKGRPSLKAAENLLAILLLPEIGFGLNGDSTPYETPWRNPQGLPEKNDPNAYSKRYIIERMANLIRSLFSANDEQMMWRVKLNDDPHAFACLMAKWEKPIRSLCARMTGDTHRAEDLTQTAFSKVFARRADWQPAAKFSTFLWRIAINLCHDEARKTKRRGESSLEALEEAGASFGVLEAEEPGPDAQIEARERGELVRRALEKLAPNYREVVVLRHYEGLKFQEIAEVLGVPQGTVKSRMAEALSQLNHLLRHLNEEISCNSKNQTPELLAL